VITEPSNGILAERGGLDLAQAVALLRGHARASGRRLSDRARDVVDGTTSIDALLLPTPGQSR
jgi:hypothetical protein